MGRANERQFIMGLFTDQESLDQWFSENILDINFRTYKDEQEDIEVCDAILCLDLEMEGRSERLVEIASGALDEGKLLIWAVDGEADWRKNVEGTFKKKGATILTNLDVLDPPTILDQIDSVWQKWKERQAAEKAAAESVKKGAADAAEIRSSPTNKSVNRDEEQGPSISQRVAEGTGSVVSVVGRTFTRISETIKRKAEGDEDASYSPHAILPDVLENVIAVAGYEGCGSSFMAWNIARSLDRPVSLVEGRTTGKLAQWLGRNGEPLVTRDSFLESGVGTLHSETMDLALLANRPISSYDLQKIIGIDKEMVIDCGSDFQSEVFRHAKTRVFVVAPDPGLLNLERPDVDCINVLNQYPNGFPVAVSELEKRFDMEFKLVVPADPRQAFTSLWSKRPYIMMRDIPEFEKWKRIFDSESE